MPVLAHLFSGALGAGFVFGSGVVGGPVGTCLASLAGGFLAGRAENTDSADRHPLCRPRSFLIGTLAGIGLFGLTPTFNEAAPVGYELPERPAIVECAGEAVKESRPALQEGAFCPLPALP